MPNESRELLRFELLEKIFDAAAESCRLAEKNIRVQPDPSDTDWVFEANVNYVELRKWKYSENLWVCEGIRLTVEDKGAYKRYDTAFVQGKESLFSANNRTVSQLLSTAKKDGEYLPTSLLAKRFPKMDQCKLVAWLIIAYYQENGYRYVISSDNKVYELERASSFFAKCYLSLCRARLEQKPRIGYAVVREIQLTKAGEPMLKDSRENFSEYFWKGYQLRYISDERERLNLILRNWRILVDGKRAERLEDCDEAKRRMLLDFFSEGSGRSETLRNQLVEKFRDFPLAIILLNRPEPRYARTQQLLREITTISFEDEEAPGLTLAPPTEAIRAKIMEPFAQGAPVKPYRMNRYFRVLGSVAALAKRNRKDHSFTLEECGLRGDRERIILDALENKLLRKLPNGRIKFSAKEYRLAIQAFDKADMLNRACFKYLDKEIAWRMDRSRTDSKSPLDRFIDRFNGMIEDLVLGEAEALPEEQGAFVYTEEKLEIDSTEEAGQERETAKTERPETNETKPAETEQTEARLLVRKRSRRWDPYFHAERRFSSQAIEGSLLLSELDLTLQKLALKKLIEYAKNYEVNARLEQMCALSVLTFFLCENVGRLTPEEKIELYKVCFARTLYEEQARLLPHIREKQSDFDDYTKAVFKQACALREPELGNIYFWERSDRRIASGFPYFNFLQGEEGLYTEQELQRESLAFRRLIRASRAQAQTWFLGDRKQEIPTLKELLKLIYDSADELKRRPKSEDSLCCVYTIHMACYALANASYRQQKQMNGLVNDFVRYLDGGEKEEEEKGEKEKEEKGEKKEKQGHLERLLSAILLADYWNRRRAIGYGLPEAKEYYILDGAMRLVCEYRLWNRKHKLRLENMKSYGIDPETCRSDYARYIDAERRYRPRYFFLLMRFIGMYGVNCKPYLNNKEIRKLYPEEETQDVVEREEDRIHRSSYESGYEGDYGEEAWGKARAKETERSDAKDAEKRKKRLFLPYDHCPDSFAQYEDEVCGRAARSG